MTDKQTQGWVYPLRPAVVLLSALREIGGQVDALAFSMRLQWLRDDQFRFVFPLNRRSDTKNGRVALREALKLEYTPEVKDLESLPGTLPLREGLAAMLYRASRESVPESDQLKPEGNEHLYVVQGSDDQLQRLGDAAQLQATASSTRIYALPEQGHLGVYRIVDDRERDSVAQALHDAGLLEAARVFDVFASPSGTVYLPREEERSCRPPATAVEDFLSVVQKKALRGELGTSVDWLFADFDENNRLTVYALAPLGENDPQQALPLSVEILEMPEPAIDSDALQEASDEMGYRLELRPSFSRDASHRDQSYVQEELGRIQEEILSLEAKYDFLITTDDCWPMLYRFRQDQLSALVCALRSFPVKDLESGRVKYAFSASEAHSEGAHYVYFEPDSTMMSNDFPEIYWDQHLGPRPYVFTYDPFWASHYAKSSKSKVFVPKGSALFPQLHSWNVEGMDGYLGRIMKIYFEEGLPEYPLYIFDQAVGRDDRVAVHVLEFDKFSRFPDQIGWLNDGLQFLDVRRDVQPQIQEIARQSRELEALEELDRPPERAADLSDQIADELSERVGRGQKRVEAQLDELDTGTRAAADEVLGSLTAMMNETARRASGAKTRSEKMLGRLNCVIDVFNRHTSAVGSATKRSADEIERERGELDQIKTDAEEADKNVEALDTAITTMNQRLTQVRQLVAKSEGRKNEVVERAIGDLKKLRAELDRILLELD